MNWVMLLLQLIPTIIKLVSFAEGAFKDTPQSGDAKKTLVLGVARTFVDGITAVSTGGQKESWTLLAGPISMVIDLAVSLLFPHEEK